MARVPVTGGAGLSHFSNRMLSAGYEVICLDSFFIGGRTNYRRPHNVSIRVTHVFNTNGPFIHPYEGISNFIVQALRDRDANVARNGGQTRSFSYRHDLVEGLLRLTEAPDAVFMRASAVADHTLHRRPSAERPGPAP